MLGPKSLFDGFHLVFQTEFHLLQSNFFKLFVFGEVTLLGEGFEALRVLLMFLSQFAELIVAGQELVADWSCHPWTSYR
jgi:hypothetical protein